MIIGIIMVMSLLCVFAASRSILRFRRRAPLPARVISAWGYRDPTIFIKQMGWRQLAVPLTLGWLSICLAALAIYQVMQ